MLKTWTRSWRKHRKPPYPLSLYFNLCLPRWRKGEPGQGRDRVRKGWGGGNWLLILPKAKRRACMSYPPLALRGYNPLPRGRQLQTHPITSTSRKKRDFKVMTPKRSSKERLQTNSKRSPAWTQSLNPLWAPRFNTTPLMLPPLLALLLLERSKEEQRRVLSPAQRSAI